MKVTLIIFATMFFLSLASASQNFSYVVMPDTQSYSKMLNGSNPLYTDMSWILNNTQSLNIVMVSQLGDLVDSDWDVDQWNVINYSISRLNGNVPYHVLLGNHDYNIKYNNLTMFDSYYPLNETNYTDSYSNESLRTYYQIIQQENLSLGFAYIRYAPSNEELQWLSSAVQSHNETLWILSTHDYYNENGRSQTGNDIYNNVIKDSTNVLMIDCGHQPAETASVDIRNGTYTYQFLEDWELDRDGKLRYYTFVPDENKVYGFDYIPNTNQTTRTFSFSYGTNESNLTGNWEITKPVFTGLSSGGSHRNSGGGSSRPKPVVNETNVTNVTITPNITLAAEPETPKPVNVTIIEVTKEIAPVEPQKTQDGLFRRIVEVISNIIKEIKQKI